MNKSLDELIVKLTGYLGALREQKPNNESIGKFPSKRNLLSNNEAHIKIIIEQGERLLSLNKENELFGLKFHQNDKAVLMENFAADLEQFATTKGFYLGGKHVLSYGQSRIAEHAFFHLAASPLLPNTYATIEQHAGQVFSVYSIPFKIRVALENKIKSIIGFRSLNIIKKNGRNDESYELPFTHILNELKHTKCLDLPCSLDDIKNIYQWSCNFCHTGEKEPLWLSMKALEMISPLFIFKYQKIHEIDIADLWHRYVLSAEYITSKLIDYKGPAHPVYYFKKGWSIQKLQKHLNNPKDSKRKYSRKDATEIIFNLSETELCEVSCYWCSRTKEHY
ncbi:hypothetical protein [Klebsiella pneumoniae]|uniref:hypothetical protein n=1 Tax=Klebsiella pneumoniae TaxID=573 RepID=UPI00385BD065